MIVRALVVAFLALSACTPTPVDKSSHHSPAEGEGSGVGEGEGAVAEGEGVVGEGEGEGVVGEGEGVVGEGEGEGEGEGTTTTACIDAVTAGDLSFQCDGLQVDAHVPAQCAAGGCGLILELHGDTGTGPLVEQHLALDPQGDAHGFIIVAPTGPPYGFGQPGSTWHSDDDASLVDIVTQFIDAFAVDATRVHVTGFSRGGFVTWRLICDHADLFASAAPGAAGDGSAFGETTCFVDGSAPSRQIPIAYLMGRTDAAVGFASMQTMRDAAVASYGATGPTVLDSDSTYAHNQWVSQSGTVIETFEHSYATVPDGPWGSAQGHCIPGSTMDPYAPQYALPCAPPNSFVWGDEVMQFFLAHPMSP